MLPKPPIRHLPDHMCPLALLRAHRHYVPRHSSPAESSAKRGHLYFAGRGHLNLGLTAAEEGCEGLDVPDIVVARLVAELAHGHVFEHAAAKIADGLLAHRRAPVLRLRFETPRSSRRSPCSVTSSQLGLNLAPKHRPCAKRAPA